jgi:hypothetical protein
MLVCLLLGWAWPRAAEAPELRVYPTGRIYEYRWKLLELALAHCGGAAGNLRLVPYAGDITQNRSVLLTQSGAIDVVALGITADREASLLPVPVDILKGIIGYRIFLIRGRDQGRISGMDDAALVRELTYGLQRDWADRQVMVANGCAVESASRSESLFWMLMAGRFDAFPRGLNEARQDLAEHREAFPGLALEQDKALYFPYPVYFWVNREHAWLAREIERGLKRALADGSFRNLFLSYHSREIALMKGSRRHVLFLGNPLLPAGTVVPDTRWWWQP